MQEHKAGEEDEDAEDDEGPGETLLKLFGAALQPFFHGVQSVSVALSLRLTQRAQTKRWSERRLR